MNPNEDVHPNSPTGGGGPGNFRSASPAGMNPEMDGWMRPGPLCSTNRPANVALNINGTIVAGGPLSPGTVSAVNNAAKNTPAQWRRFIAFADKVKVGGSLAWRANNPGNLRDAATKIGSVSGAVGRFAVFASLADGRAAQKSLYQSKYGTMKVRDAINKLTPPSENNTERYLNQLQAAGINLDQDINSQIDLVMKGVEANEGLIQGTEIARVP